MRIALVLVLVATAGCPFSDEDGDGSKYVAVEQIGAAFKDAHCEYAARCGMFPDKATCLGAALAVDFDLGATLEAAIAANRVLYDGSRVRACFDAIAQRSCDRTSASARVFPVACIDFVRGTVATGQSCTIDEECISQDCAGGSTGATCATGTCVGDTPPSFEPAPLGAPCDMTNSCEQGAYCDHASLECVALKTVNMPCGSHDECNYGLGCIGLTGERTCQALPRIGQPCPEAECRDAGAVCIGAMCQPVGLASSPCVSSEECSPYYPCNPQTNTCTKGPGLGEPCSSGSRCFDAGTFCDPATLTCGPLRADGMPCTNPTQCQSEYCDFNTLTCAAEPVCR